MFNLHDIRFINIRNKIGTTRVTIIAPNGISCSFNVAIHYPIEKGNESFLKMQIEDFEEISINATPSTPKFVYLFPGVGEDDTTVYDTKLLVGSTYNFYYLLGPTNAEGDKFQVYTDLTGIMSVQSAESMNSDCVEISGRLIKVKKYSADPVSLRFAYKTLVGGNKEVYIYININVHFERPITSISTDEIDIKIYDYNSINSDVYIGNTDKKYIDEYATKSLTLSLSPENITTKYNIQWLAGPYQSSAKNIGYYKYTQSNNGSILFTIPNTTMGRVKLIPSNDKQTININVLNIPSNEFRFFIYASVTQSYYSAYGEYIENDELLIKVPVYVVKATQVDSINTKVYNNEVSFDIRKMNDTAGVGGSFTSNNTFDFEYELLPEKDVEGNIIGDGILIHEIGYQRPNSDIEIVAIDDNKLRLIVREISDEFNISQSRISRIIQNALEKIKKELLKQEQLDGYYI